MLSVFSLYIECIELSTFRVGEEAIQIHGLNITPVIADLYTKDGNVQEYILYENYWCCLHFIMHFFTFDKGDFLERIEVIESQHASRENEKV